MMEQGDKIDIELENASTERFNRVLLDGLDGLVEPWLKLSRFSFPPGLRPASNVVVINARDLCRLKVTLVRPNFWNLKVEYNDFKSSISSGEADLQETKAALQSVAKKVFEIKDKAEALHDTAEIKHCRALIRVISRELRYVESEFYKLYLQAVLWLLLFIAEKCDSTSRSLPVRVLSISQALEVVLIASGDVEENPGPTFLDVEADAPVILKAISPVAARYLTFLCVLGLPEDQLSRIKTEYREDPLECLREGIICLLKENYNTDKYGLLTWRRLVEAVADTAGGNDHSLARKIAADHEHRELPDSSVNKDRECLKLAIASANPSTQQKYKQSGSFAITFPKLKRNLERSLKPGDLKEFLRYFCNPASPEHCLVDKQLYDDLDSTSQILDSLHPTHINPANLLLLQEIVDNFGSRQSKTLLRNYNSQWE